MTRIQSAGEMRKSMPGNKSVIDWIMERIEAEALANRASLSISHLSTVDKGHLEAAGYKVTYYSDPRDNDSEYIISW